MRTTSPRRGRKVVRAEVSGWGLGVDSEWLDTLELLTSEVITNALLHADSHQIYVDARQDDEGGGVRVSVSDNDYRGPLLLPDEHPRVLGGRGLPIVQALADQWGIDSFLFGKAIWFRLENSP